MSRRSCHRSISAQVCELADHGLLGEGLLPTLREVLASGTASKDATIIPCGAYVEAALFEDASLAVWNQPARRVPWLRRAVRNQHRHAIEQASRRWRGGRRDDSARTRRKILMSTQVAREAAGPRRLPPAAVPGRRIMFAGAAG